jgi:hypothetical protein
MDAAWCVDFHILPSHQRQGIGKKLLDCAFARIPLLLTLGQTDASYGLFLKASWHGKDGHLIRSKRILRPFSVALKRFGVQASARSSSVGREIPENAGPFGPMRITTLKSWTGERDMFTGQGDIEPDGHGLVARTVEFLEWRYARHPKLRYTFLKITACETNQLVAYAVVRFGLHGIYSKASLCDLIPAPPWTFAAQGLQTATVAAITAFCRLCGAELFETQMSPQPEVEGRIAAALSKNQPGHRFLYGMARMEGCTDLPISSWRLSPGDCDVDLLEGMAETEP